MRQPCPKSCPSLRHPEAGFYRICCKAGETFTINRDHVNTFLFFMKGSCVMDSYEVKDFRIEEGHFVLCYRDFQYDFNVESDMEVIACYFANPGNTCDLGTMSAVLRKRKQGFDYKFKALPFKGAFAETLSLASRYIDDEIACSYMHHSMLELVFVNLKMYYTQNEQLNLLYNLFDHSMSFMTLLENNRTKANSLRELAEAVGLTINQFNDHFRRNNPGVAPRDWFQSKRKVEILNDIKNTEVRLYDLSEKYGFSGPGNFCAYCKREFGELPSYIRKKHRETLKADKEQTE